MSTIKRVRIGVGKSYELTAWNVGSLDAPDSTLTVLEAPGVDEFPTLRRNTSTPLYGHGEVVSPTASWNARMLEFSFFAQYPSGVPIRAIRQSIAQLAFNPRLLQPIDITHYEKGSEVFRQLIHVRLDEDPLANWKQTGNSVEFTLAFIAPDPFYTVFLNGDTEPSTQKRL